MAKKFDAETYFNSLDKDLQTKIREAYDDGEVDDDELFERLADLHEEGILTTPDGKHYLGELPVPFDRAHFYVSANGKGGLVAKCIENGESYDVVREDKNYEEPEDKFELGLSEKMYDSILKAVSAEHPHNKKLQCLVELEDSCGCGGRSFGQWAWGPDGQYMCRR